MPRGHFESAKKSRPDSIMLVQSNARFSTDKLSKMKKSQSCNVRHTFEDLDGVRCLNVSHLRDQRGLRRVRWVVFARARMWRDGGFAPPRNAPARASRGPQWHACCACRGGLSIPDCGDRNQPQGRQGDRHSRPRFCVRAAESQRTPNRAQGAARRCMSTRGSDSQYSSARPSHLDWTDVCRQQREPVTGLRKRIARAVLAARPAVQ
jgi:hypothetical protein